MSRINMFLCGAEGLVPLLFVVVFIIYFYKKHRISFKVLGVGILIFFVFSQILEKLLHLYVLYINHSTSAYLLNHPILYAAYGAFTAGFFEEVGRYFGFQVLLRKYRLWKDGFAYGLGHGGIEVLLVGTLVSMQILVFAMLFNKGQLPILQQKLPPAALTQIMELIHQPSYMYVLGALERIISLFIQIALSLVILYGIRKRKVAYLLLAILLHAGVDFIPGLYQARVVPIFFAEWTLVIPGLISIAFIVWSKRLWLCWSGDSVQK